MERKITTYLQKWKNDLVRKPLLIYGPKQVGKTFAILEFGEKEYKNVVYFNTDNNKELDDLFTKEKSPERIILSLSLSKVSIISIISFLFFMIYPSGKRYFQHFDGENLTLKPSKS